MNDQAFSEEQQNYLMGFAAGSTSARVAALALPTFAGTLGIAPGPKPPSEAAPPSPDAIHRAAQDRFTAAGKKLSPEELAKRAHHGLDAWDLMLDHARDVRFPKGTDVFLLKFLGLFYIAPAQDSFMCRLRLPGGILTDQQVHGIADLAARFGGGYADATTRANLQIRQISPGDAPHVLMGLYDLGIINKGAGADNIRNITASPTAGIDPQELIDTRPLARQMHYYILNHRELYGLPRKFNIAFDGGGRVGALEDTNDVGFSAVGVGPGLSVPPGVYFRMILGGITGHQDFARDAGVVVRPEQCVDVAAAVIRVFIEHGDRTDRRKARLKYLLDRWGVAKFMEAVEKHLPAGLVKFPLADCRPRGAIDKHGHVGVHPQKQPGKSYLGVVLPVGRMTAAQMHALADLARQYGSGTLRLTVWQNLLISDIDDADVGAVKAGLEKAGLHWSATSVRGGLVACTGNAGCKFAAGDTKRHAVAIADFLEPRVPLDQPINIHLTGCPHSCAQHYIGDIGLLATKVEVGEELEEGYHVFVGGGYGAEQGLGREVSRNVPAPELPALIERMLRAYLRQRRDARETFRQFVLRHPTAELQRALHTDKAASP